MENRNPDRLELLAQIASFYFEEELSQHQIAERTGYSPSMISRLLSEARKQGLVEIRVNSPLRRCLELEQELQERLGLKIVRIVGHDLRSERQMLRRLGRMAAKLIEELVHDNITVGVTSGQSVYEAVHALRQGICAGAHVIQMTGSARVLEPFEDGQDLPQHLARALIGYYTPLPAPLFVADEATRNALLTDPQIARTFERFNEIELALVGVGALDPEQSTLVRVGYLNTEQLFELEQNGAVGEVCGRFFDLYGNLVELPLGSRVVGIGEAELAKIPLKIGIAGGPHKVLPIIGASRAHLIDVLVTDEGAATRMNGILKRMSSWREQSEGTGS